MVRILTLALLVGTALAQTPTGNTSLAAAALPAPVKDAVESASTVAPGDTVLTIQGICSSAENLPSAGHSACTLLVKRQQFEDLMKIVAPGVEVNTASKQRLAKTYTDLLAFESAARKSGIDNAAQFRDTMAWLRLRTLADLYRRSLEREFAAVSESEIDEYYHQHIQQYEEVKLRRILLPRNNFSAGDKKEFEQKTLQIATQIQSRAAKGEDLDQLQKEAYSTLGFNGLPPASEAGNRRRSSLPSEVSADVFALQPGGVSPV